MVFTNKIVTTLFAWKDSADSFGPAWLALNTEEDSRKSLVEGGSSQSLRESEMLNRKLLFVHNKKNKIELYQKIDNLPEKPVKNGEIKWSSWVPKIVKTRRTMISPAFSETESESRFVWNLLIMCRLLFDIARSLFFITWGRFGCFAESPEIDTSQPVEP